MPKGAQTSFTIAPEELVGRTYLTEPQENGERYRAKIVRQVIDYEDGLERHPARTRYLVEIGNAKADEIIAYSDILDHLELQAREEIDPSEQLWKFKDIVGHEGPLRPGDHSYKGSSYNLLVAWEDGTQTYEPLNVIAADDQVNVALYGKRNDLLDLPGWKRFKRLAHREKKMLRMVNQANLKSVRRAAVYEFGYRVPRTPAEAKDIDLANRNTKWQDAQDLEIVQLTEYETFKDLGRGANAPDGYKRIRVHFVYAVKHDGRHKARLVAGGHLTDIPLDSVYSGVVSLRSLRIVLFLAELNGLDIFSADVGNAYLEAYTNEKVYIVAGEGFGELAGRTLVISKALYGLRSSGLRWHERFADTLRDMGFFISRADGDVWMRKNGQVYEYIAVYVDDLAIAAKDPKSLCDELTTRYKYKLKGVGPITHYRGCGFWARPRRYDVLRAA